MDIQRINLHFKKNGGKMSQVDFGFGQTKRQMLKLNIHRVLKRG